MRSAFIAIFAALVLLSLVAWRMIPATVENGKTQLVWVTDPNPARDQQIATFNRLNPTDELSLDANNEGMEKIIVQSLAGTGPDLFDAYDRGQLMAFVRSGIAWDVTDQFKARGINATSAVWPACRSAITWNGRIYGFPTNTSVTGLWYNKDIFDQAHVPYPSGRMTWPQLAALAQKLVVRDANGRITRYGLVADSWVWPMFVWQHGGSVYSPDGTRCTISTPQAAAGFEDFNDLAWKYHVMPTPAEEAAMAAQGGWGSGAINQFGGGRAAMAIGARWWLVQLRKDNLRLGATPLPYSDVQVYFSSTRATLVNAASPRRRQALDFLAFEDSPQYNALVNHEADGICAVIKDSDTPSYFHDPAYPKEDYNKTWRNLMRFAKPEEVSPYVNPTEVNEILQRQVDLIQGNEKPVAQALADAQNQVNAAIAKSIAEDPALRRQYDDQMKLDTAAAEGKP